MPNDPFVEDDIYNSVQYQELFMENIELQNTVDYLEHELEQYEDNFNGIFDVEDFKYYLRQDNLLNPELEEFINYYIRYRNQKPRKEEL